MRFDGKITLVTGAASGIGLAIARQFVAEGATVIGTDINQQSLDQLDAEGCPELVTRLSDAGDLEQIAELADWIRQKFGALDVLVNNAGYSRLANPETVEEDRYADQTSLMITGPIFLVKHFAPLLRASEDGSVVNVASLAALVSMPGYCPYGVVKAAVSKFSEDCTVQVPGIRHNVVLPGFIDTPAVTGAYGEEAATALNEFMTANCPVPRMGRPEEIAEAVLFLASSQASYINGAKLIVDGGLSRIHATTMFALASGT